MISTLAQDGVYYCSNTSWTSHSTHLCSVNTWWTEVPTIPWVSLRTHSIHSQRSLQSVQHTILSVITGCLCWICFSHPSDWSTYISILIRVRACLHGAFLWDSDSWNWGEISWWVHHHCCPLLILQSCYRVELLSLTRDLQSVKTPPAIENIKHTTDHKPQTGFILDLEQIWLFVVLWMKQIAKLTLTGWLVFLLA